jgi:hypothetical protein
MHIAFPRPARKQMSASVMLRPKIRCQGTKGEKASEILIRVVEGAIVAHLG